MDSEYLDHAPAFRPALELHLTVISANPKWGVLDGGLKCLGMDHGNPEVLGQGSCWFVSDEHITVLWDDAGPLPVGDRMVVRPAHVDPTVAYHERMWVRRGDAVIDEWPIDLRAW